MKKPINVLGRLVIIDCGHLLAVRKEGWSFLPGGHVEYNEGLKETIRRECMEEFAGRAMVEDFLGILEHSFEPGDGPYHEINFVFRGKLLNVKYPNLPRSLEPDLEVIWVSLEKLEENNLLPKEIWPLINDTIGDNKWLSTMERQ